MEQIKTMVNIDSSLNLKNKDLQLESPFVTIFLPLNYDGEKSPYTTLEELIEEVKAKLASVSSGAEDSLNSIYKKLNRLIVKLPPQNLYKSVVAFLSEDVEDIIPLNYSVDTKAVISDNFDFEEVNKLNSQEEQLDREVEEALKRKLLSDKVESRLFGKRTY